jgi:hypothetical protein
MKTNPQPKSVYVYVVSAYIEYEGFDPIAVTSSVRLARVARDAHKAARKAAGRWSYDGYNIRRFKLDTVG